MAVSKYPLNLAVLLLLALLLVGAAAGAATGCSPADELGGVNLLIHDPSTGETMLFQPCDPIPIIYREEPHA